MSSIFKESDFGHVGELHPTFVINKSKTEASHFFFLVFEQGKRNARAKVSIW